MVKSKYADNRQAELYKKFPSDSFLGDPKNLDHVFLWITFFRRNLHRFAMDYLGVKLYTYQIIMLYLMGINRYIVIIASRATAKSFVIALYACCRSILYPDSRIVLTSATKGQSKLIVSEKIEKELYNMSPMLRREIKDIRKRQDEMVVTFYNGSSITVVPASDNGRGYRSTCIIREEFRQIKKIIEDSVISPFQIIRQTPFSKNDYYANKPELKEEPIDIYISSSWYDNGHWMWGIVDQAYKEMMEGRDSCLLAFDESVTLMHGIKSMKNLQADKKKQDPVTWQLEYMNARIKENVSAYFTYNMLDQNRKNRMPFYPRRTQDVLGNRKNPYDIPKQGDEVRVVVCDMAFVENKRNDNSVFTCMRLLPETSSYESSSGGDIVVSNGYRRIPCYMEHVQGGDTDMQARRIRQLYNDFDSDYICLDIRNAGISIYDRLAKVMYDEERKCEYPPLSCMNDEKLAARINSPGAEARIYVINASAKLNSDIAIDFRRVLMEGKIEFLPTYSQALETILPNIKEYIESPDPDEQLFYEGPFLETQELFTETTELLYKKDPVSGRITVYESGNNRKDRYTSCSYGSYFATILENDLSAIQEDYEFGTFIN